ncbi:hypothetical protein KSS87_013669 [Heliosperma pusillum]|nr:hypothetical protein KSS87_013669 [Heliosperma pusillum]
MKLQKRKCSSACYADAGPDRLSEMPDEIIVHILSCMPTFDAVRTMLIRRFGNLWTLVHTLNFVVPEVLDTMAVDSKWRNDVGQFNIFVRNVLMRHKRPFIDKFHLLLGCLYENGSEEARDDIRMWLKFALEKQAKEIYFCDVRDEFSFSSEFPNFTSQSLMTLELRNCTIFPEFQVNLGSLKKLILRNTGMREEAFQQFICGCPSLQELRINEPTMKNLKFSAPNIRKLSLVFMKEPFFYDPWSLDVPNLKSLDLETIWIPDVIDVSSIRDVYLKGLDFAVTDEDELKMFIVFLEKFSRSEVFQLSLDASEAFRASAKLPPVELFDPCVMPKLKIVTLHGYAKPWKHQLQLVEFLLKSATFLEKLVIVPNQRHKMNFVMRVSTFQRSSPSARVLFL